MSSVKALSLCLLNTSETDYQIPSLYKTLIFARPNPKHLCFWACIRLHHKCCHTESSRCGGQHVDPHLQPHPAGLQGKPCLHFWWANNFERAKWKISSGSFDLLLSESIIEEVPPGSLVLVFEIQLSHRPAFRNRSLQCGQRDPPRGVRRSLPPR